MACRIVANVDRLLTTGYRLPKEVTSVTSFLPLPPPSIISPRRSMFDGTATNRFEARVGETDVMADGTFRKSSKERYLTRMASRQDLAIPPKRSFLL